MLTPWKESYDQPRQHIKKQRHYFVNKVPSSQGYGFSIGHVWMWELYYKQSWAPKNWCFWTVVLEKTLESPLDCKEIQPVHPKGDQSWVFIGRIWGWSWNSNTLATWWEKLIHLKRPWCWERLKAGGEEDDRGWDDLMALRTQWTWVLVNSRSWWWTVRTGMLWFKGSQRVGHGWATESLTLLLLLMCEIISTYEGFPWNKCIHLCWVGQKVCLVFPAMVQNPNELFGQHNIFTHIFSHHLFTQSFFKIN